MKMKKIGFFGGTFDPIHFGHLNLAIEMLERHHLDEILFCPAFCSPFKDQPVANGQHRLEMVQRAITGIDRCRVSSVEIDRGGPSYTIDTLRALHSEGEFRLLLSDESIGRFDQWKEAQELVRLAPPLIGTRREALTGKGAIAEALRRGITPTRVFEISSTEVRERLKKKLYCGHLIPAKTLEYIQQQHLYS